MSDIFHLLCLVFIIMNTIYVECDEQQSSLNEGWTSLSCSVCVFSPTHMLSLFYSFSPPSLPVCFLSLSLSLLFSLALSLPDLYFTLPLLPLLLPETNSLATSCSVSQKGRVSLWCHSNPIQHQTVRHATLLTRKSQEGLLRIRLWTGRRE